MTRSTVNVTGTPVPITNSILRRTKDEHVSVNRMQLNKMLFLITAHYAKNTNMIPFTERFAVWKYGPVLVSINDYFASFESYPIDHLIVDNDGLAIGVNEEDSPQMVQSLDIVWRLCKGLTPAQLAQITVSENGAWARARNDGNTIIDDEYIVEDNSIETLLKYYIS